MKVLTGVVVVVSAGVLVAAGGSGRRTSAPLKHRFALPARRLALAMNDSLPARTAKVYGPASYRVALHAWSATARAPRSPRGHWYVIVIRGHFVWNGPFRSSRGSFAARLWSAGAGNSGIGYSGVSRALPAAMSRLRGPRLIDLTSWSR
jgi:hypothetical protein